MGSVFAVDFSFAFSMMKQNKKYMSRVRHSIVCSIAAYSMHLALSLLYGVQLINLDII